MTVVLKCPGCQAKYKVKKVARKVTCAKCQTTFESADAVANSVDGPRGTSTSGVGKPQGPAKADSVDSGSANPVPKPAALVSAPRRLQSSESTATGATGTDHQSVEVSGTENAEDSLLRSSSQPKDQASSDRFSLTNSGTRKVESAGSGIEIHAPAHASTYPMRPQKNIWVTLTSLLLAVAAIGGLFAIVTVLGQPSSSQQTVNTSPDELVDANKEGNGSADESDGQPENKRSAEAKRATAPKLPPIKEKLQYFTPRQCELLWKKINGYLVKLEIRTPLTTRIASGLIVDSRGWVVTSLSALKDAGQVSVTLAAKNLEDSPPYRDLVDLSRGIIATDPANDLALISINRAQVINLADIPIDDSERVVQSSRLLIARTPPPRHLQWLTECRVDAASTRELMPENAKRALESANVPAGSNNRWISFPVSLPTNLTSELAGSGLINGDGQVVGLNTGITFQESALAVSGKAIRNLIDSVPPGTPPGKPFPKAQDLLQQQVTETAVSEANEFENPDGTPVSEDVRLTRAFKVSLENLAKATSVCRKTDWSAELASEYSAMQDLSKYLDEVFEWSARYMNRLDTDGSLQELLNEAMDAITQSVEDDLVNDEFLAGKGNSFFFDQVNQANPWFMLSARVHSDQFNSPQINGQETVVFEISGTDKHIIAAAGLNARSFRKGRRFMLFGRLSEQGKFKSRMFEGEPEIPLVDVHTHFLLQQRTR